jgi:nitrogenase molybdenum-iron protein alpha/beta subunit
MPECTNPLWPCAMTGAAACLAGFDGMTVVIHGSSGCYYYPTTLLHAPLHGTFILEEEVIFGSEQRLVQVIKDVASSGQRIAVVTTCVPSLLGEDIKAMLASYDVLLVDSPGFSGDFETGYRTALSDLKPLIDQENKGVNIDGVCLFDPFYKGNVRELSRLLRKANVTVATVFCADVLGRVQEASPFTIGTNGDIASGVGETLGGTLGIKELRDTFCRIGNTIDCADVDPVLQEIAREEDRIIQVCDKFLRRFDPPRVAVFSWASYAEFAADTLRSFLDAEIACIGNRTASPPDFPFAAEPAEGLAQVTALIEKHKPDLVIGSSFERSVRGDAAFVGLTPPLRGKVRLASRPIAGIEGTLGFIEDALNACMDRTP